MSIDKWFHIDEYIFAWMNFIYKLDLINKSLDEIHPQWILNKLKNIYIHLHSLSKY